MYSNRLSTMLATGVLLMGTCLSAAALTGCERKERVLDIEAPGADVEVDRNLDTGEVEVEVND